MDTIRQIVPKIKSFFSGYAVELGVSLIIIVVAFSSFYLGMASIGSGSGGITIENIQDLTATTTSLVEGEDIMASANQALAPETKVEAKGTIVASKNGVRYYYPWCSGVSRLSEKNKIYFASAAEAESFGLTIAANCVPK